MSNESLRNEIPNAQSLAHRCPQCRGEMKYDVEVQALRCHHCGHTQTISRTSGQIIEYDLEQGLAQDQARGFGASTRITKCGECGAAVHFGESVTAMHCVFCGSL